MHDVIQTLENVTNVRHNLDDVTNAALSLEFLEDEMHKASSYMKSVRRCDKCTT